MTELKPLHLSVGLASSRWVDIARQGPPPPADLFTPSEAEAPLQPRPTLPVAPLPTPEPPAGSHRDLLLGLTATAVVGGAAVVAGSMVGGGVLSGASHLASMVTHADPWVAIPALALSVPLAPLGAMACDNTKSDVGAVSAAMVGVGLAMATYAAIGGSAGWLLHQGIRLAFGG